MINYLNYVNPKIGTNNTRRFSEGNILPITGLPNQLASFTIQTHRKDGFDKRWFYNPNLNSFEGIRLTHQPSPWVGDYGYLLIMPTDLRGTTNNSDTWYSSYDGSKTIIKPHFMQGKLFKDNIDFMMSPTNRGAIFKFIFNSSLEHEILLIGQEGELSFKKDGINNLIIGKTNVIDHEINFPLWSYFVIKVDKEFNLIQKTDNIYSIVFKDHDVTMKLATSFISEKQAMINLETELANRTFDEIKETARLLWEEKLSKIQINTNTKNLKEMFYTSLYRMFLFPRVFHEYNELGKPIHLNLEKGSIETGVMYVDNGFWDTHKTAYPLYALIDKSLYKDILEGIRNYYNEIKKLPKWLSPNDLGYMPGELVHSVIADAIIKNIVSKEEAAEFIKIMIANDNNEKSKSFNKYGYFPSDLYKESINETLDASYVNFCIYNAAKHLNMQIDEKFYINSKNYQNIYDKETNFMRPKDSFGVFLKDFNPFDWGKHYTEGSAWQNSFNVYYDISGLNKLSNNTLLEKIDLLFNTPPIFNVGGFGVEIHEMSEMAILNLGQCAISNQPSFHIPYIYSELGNVSKTYEKIKLIMSETFLNKKYPGDEDNGSMAGWFIFTVLGFYPLAPSTNKYTVSFPLIEKAIIKLSSDKKIKINTKNLNINVMNNNITYSDLINGGLYEEIVMKKVKKGI